MKTVYLCGGIHGLTDEECNGWRIAATKALQGRFQVLNPMVRDARGKELDGRVVAQTVEDDMADIRKSHIILVNATRPSWGTAMEVFFASSRPDTVVIAFGAGDIPSIWLQYHCDYLCLSLMEAIGIVKVQ